ncbi:DNA-deoxyinosine glycosylase [Hydrogenophaga sp.]|uniref:DNA-deoxyinosine glycosylase n=1 Tax=Hydrogenophaga sp. TaxID=1904254 RepID=UPI0025C59486|nr:DNA-deoxyinosine glycosylase [Hydrogenophaga sp.]
MVRLVGLAPMVDINTRMLVLGSFPSVASLRAQQYYGHPQNQFWKILGSLWSQDLMACSYAERIASARVHGLGIWDVYAACERVGSLDTAIRAGELNDFAGLRQRCPQLQAIAHNGGESFKHARHTAVLGLPVHKLPSTSPANASWSFERKLQAWRNAFEAAGVAAPNA